jgi:hypothetical protein
LIDVSANAVRFRRISRQRWCDVAHECDSSHRSFTTAFSAQEDQRSNGGAPIGARSFALPTKLTSSALTVSAPSGLVNVIAFFLGARRSSPPWLAAKRNQRSGNTIS